MAKGDRTRLTETFIMSLRLPPDKADLTVWDTEVVGLGVRVRPTGKTWVLGFRPAGTGRSGTFKRMKLASTSAVRSVTEARSLARAELGRVARGDDPLAARAEAKAREKRRLGDIIDRYDAALATRGYVNRAASISTLRRNFAAMMGRDVRDVSGAEVVAMMDKLTELGRKGAAADLRSRASAFFGFCVQKHLLPANPLAGFRKERTTRADKVAKEEHGRALSDAEIARVWLAASPDTVAGRLVRFLLLTGCRRGEGAGLDWSMVDRAQRAIVLPPIFTKQARGHDVPLFPQLDGLLVDCVRVAGSDLVFPSSRTGGPISGWSKLVTGLNEGSGVDFRLHDLRRTFRTGLENLGVPEDLAELAIGHARSELVRIYNRAQALEKLRPAFEQWGAHVAAIVAAEEAKRSAAAGGVFD